MYVYTCVYNDQRLIHPTTQLINAIITSYNLIKKFRVAKKKFHNSVRKNQHLLKLLQTILYYKAFYLLKNTKFALSSTHQFPE